MAHSPAADNDDLMTQDQQKDLAAARGAALVEPGMIVGLGTGSTSGRMVRHLGARMRELGFRVRAVCTSSVTEFIAREEEIEIIPLAPEHPIDLYLDGADEIDPQGVMIKGGGGALLREKLVARHARRRVIMVDESKRVARLGSFPLPVEVVTFGAPVTAAQIAEVTGGRVAIRLDKASGTPFPTDEGHLIVDVRLPGLIADPAALHARLLALPGVVETGIFAGLCHQLIVGTATGVETVEFTQQEDARR